MPAISDTLHLAQLAPDVTLCDSAGVPHRLYDQLGTNGTLVEFFRGFWCPYCVRQFQQLRNLAPKLAASGITVVAIMTDTAVRVAGSLYVNPAPFPVLIDDQRAAVKDYGIHDPDDEGPPPDPAIPRPAVFLLDATGRIRYAQVGLDGHDIPQMTALVQHIRALAPAVSDADGAD